MACRKTTFGFEKALKYLKKGRKLKRKGWENKGSYIQYSKIIWYRGTKEEYEYVIKSYVNMKLDDIRWSPIHADVLAKDWCFACEK